MNTPAELTRRAIAASHRAAVRLGGSPMQPSRHSGVEEHGGRLYVALRNLNGVFACYRVRNDGSLKSLKRWPAAIGKQAASMAASELA